MAEINVKRFVDVDIRRHSASKIIGTRETVVLYSGEGTASTVKMITSLAEANAEYPVSTFPTTNAYLNVFFANGGSKCKVIEGVSYSTLTAQTIGELPNEEIIVACAVSSTNASAGYTALYNIAVQRAANTQIYGVNEKIIVARTTDTESEGSVKNFAAKYSSVLGAEMLIAAYLSQINVYKEDSVQDYAFTEESITAETLTDASFEEIISNNENVDIYLSGAVRNCGGDLKNGEDLVNGYVKIILHQTITEALMNLLVTKIKSVTGLSDIYSSIVNELERYRVSGYLTTDKIWTENDLVVSYNNKSYTIIEKGTALNSGYHVVVLPMSALTETDKSERKAPPVYIIIADQYTIRKITITGEVI